MPEHHAIFSEGTGKEEKKGGEETEGDCGSGGKLREKKRYHRGERIKERKREKVHDSHSTKKAKGKKETFSDKSEGMEAEKKARKGGVSERERLQENNLSKVL